MLEYPIYDGQVVIGIAKAEKQGMFYLLRICCRPLSGEPERIVMTNSRLEIDLGRCVPNGADMTLVKRIKRAELEDASARFSVATAPENRREQERSVSEPDLLENLSRAYIGENGELTLAGLDQSSSNPTGQWSDPMISE